MSFYLVIAVVLSVVALVQVVWRKRILSLGGLAVLALWALAALRYRTGYDWLVYQAFFDQYAPNYIGDGSGMVPMEPLYVLLNIVVAKMTGSFQVLLVVIATFNIWVLYRFVKLARADLVFCCAFYFCLVYLPLQMGVFRQSLAVSMFMIGMMYASRGRNNMAMFCSVIGVGFQYSSVIYFFVYWRKGVRFVMRRPVLFVGVVLLFYALGIGVASLALEALSKLSLSFISEKAAIYASTGAFERSPGAIAYLLVNCGIFLWVNKRLPERSRFQELLFGAIILQIAFQGLLFDFPIFWNRAQYLAVLPQAILLYQAVSMQPIVVRMAVASTSLAFVVSALVYQLVNPLIEPYIPYYSYLEYKFTGDIGDGLGRTLEYYRRFEAHLQ
ncbi:EpsG family protein [Pandoraea sputorum]|uniref:EpsG family protein n=1 Tax=Pandoraea sputorum TaxID=93222 RepID=A0A5E5BAC8_9BURK|nr:EpsG family protein [Pandoraea sputorum]VVE81583.1 hypothetical protein PSP31121_03341 [Pandoraea sputorum]